jgi:hypothetical protein
MKTAPLLLFALLSSAALGADWQNISDSVTSQVKPGYAGPTAGVVVDRTDGDVFMVVSDQGLWHSTDHGTTFTRCDDGAIGGRCETGWALQADPEGRRLACFMIYGSSGITRDGGRTWTKFKTSHLDFGSVDWADSGLRFLAIRHESGGMLTTSSDGGTTWQDLGKGFSGCGAIDRQTFVATKAKEPGIFRSGDAGATWSQVSSESPSAAVPVLFNNGAAYWATGKGLLISRDKGATWAALGAPVDAAYGPFFGSETHFVVVGKSGFSETKDGGQTWQPAAPLPSGFVINRVGPSFGWGAKADLFYASTMTKPTFRFERAK